MKTQGIKIFLITLSLILVISNVSFSETTEGITSYQATAIVTAPKGPPDWKREEKIIFKEGIGSKIETLVVKGEEKREHFTIITKDVIWNYDLHNNIVYKMDLTALKKEFEQDLFKRIVGMNIRDIRRPFSCLGMRRESIIFEGVEQIDEQKMQIFIGEVEMPLIEEEKILILKIKIWVGIDNGLLYKYILYDEGGKEEFCEIYKDIVLNPEIPDSEFEFILPEGAEVKDNTESLRKALQLIKEYREKRL